MALINFYKGLKENYSPDTHGNSIYSCTDTNECYILGVLYENISEQEIADKIGTNTYTNANYISKETNLTDAAMQLDEEIKATNDNIAILNAATVKSVKVGSNTSNEQFSNGVITIANATTSTDGALSKEDKAKIDNIESTYLPLTGGIITGNLTVNNTLNVEDDIYGKWITARKYFELEDPDDGNTIRAIDTNSTYSELRLGDSVPLYLYSSDVIKRVTSSNEYTIYDSGNFIAGTNYVAPSTLNSYLPLTGGTMTGVINIVPGTRNNMINTGIKYQDNGLVNYTTDGGVELASLNENTYIRSSASDLYHTKGTIENNYKILDESNFIADQDYITPEKFNSLQLEDIVSYGIEWDTEVSDPDCTRIGNLSLHKSLPIQNKMRGCVAKGNKIQYYLNPTDWSQKEDGTPSVLDGTDGDVMVHIPKFWIKSGSNGTKRWVKIATNYIDETWTEVPEMLISAYRVTTDRTDAENIKLMSVVNTTQNFAGSFGIEDPTNPYRTALGKPRTAMSRQSARTYAHNKQDGTELLCYEYYKDVLYWLPVIEYATFNMQQAFNDELTSEGYHQGGLGSGVTNISTYIWKSYGTSYYPITPMGYTNELGNFTGTKELNLGTYSFTSKTSIDWNIWSHQNKIAHTYENNVMTITNVRSDYYACYCGFYDVGGDMTVTIQGLQEGQSVIFRASSGMEDVEVSTNEQVVIPWPQSNVSRYIYFGFTGECNITLTIDANPAVEYNNIDGGTTNVIRYRGIENIFGDIWTNLEGVLIRYNNHASGTHDVYTTSNSEYFQNTATDNMELAGTETAAVGYVKEFNLGNKANIIPSICTGASSTTYKCDYHYTYDLGSALGIYLVGGNVYHGAEAGLGYLGSNASTAVSSVDVGFRTVNILN